MNPFLQKHFPLIVWHLKTKNGIICCQNDGLHFLSGINGQKKITKATYIQSNLDYPDSRRLGWTVRIIESPDNWNIEMSSWSFMILSCWLLTHTQLINWLLFLIEKQNYWLLTFWKEWSSYILWTWWGCFDAESTLCSSNHTDWANGVECISI